MNSKKLSEKIIYQWNKTNKEYPKNKTINQLFEEQALKTPDNIAIIFEESSLTYRELNTKSNQLARVIRSYYLTKTGKNLRPDTLIGLFLEHSLEMIVSIIAVLKSGGTYVPIDTDFPQERIKYILKDAQVDIVLIQGKFKSSLDQCNKNLKLISIDKYNFADIALDNLPRQNKPDDLSCVIYTSGTTGQPKGVMQTHHNVVRLFTATNNNFKFNKTDVWTLYHNYTFDFSIWEIWGALCYGGKLVIVSKQKRKNLLEFYILLIKYKITVINQTPEVFYQLLKLLRTNKLRNLEFLELRYIILGGDKLDFSRLEDWWVLRKKKKLKAKLINMYGITETTVHATYKEVVNSSINTSIIGRPIEDIKIYILDNDYKPLPIGIKGEMYIAGAGLSRGYLNRSKLTSERFIDNPFVTKKDINNSYRKIYKTGDIAKWLPDGNIEYLGRSDFQVKVRGFRIELGEIENTLSNIKGVKQVCVLAKSRTIDKTEQQYLAVFYVLDQSTKKIKKNQNTQITSDFLIAQLKDKLPEYMIPSAWVELSELPLTANGKLDRKAFPAPDFIIEETYVAPHTDTEKKLCQIWQDILGIAKIGVTDDFFKIGVDSIVAIRAGVLLSESFNKSIYVGDIFKYWTIKTLSCYIDFQAVVNNKISIAKGKIWPLSFAQQRLCFIEEYEKGTNAYHVPWFISFVRDMNINALKQSIKYIADRHKPLKTIFKKDESGQYYQIISNHPLEIQQHHYLSENQLLKQLKTDVNIPFKLFSDHPIRVVLYQKSDTQFTHLLINVHHVAIDGWSLDILANELLQCYEHFAYQKALLLPALKIQYKDFSCWQRRYLQGERLETQLNYWRNKLLNYEALSLATDKPRPANFELIGSNVNFILDQRLSGQLKNLARKQGCTLYTLMLTGFYILLHKYTSQQDIIVGTPVANRHYPEIQHLIGFFVNHLILRQQIKSEENAKNLMENIWEDLLQAQSCQDIPFEKLVTELDIDKDTSRHPIFQIAFSVQGVKRQHSPQISQYFKTESVQTIYSVTKLDLLFIVDDAKDSMEVTINYASALFNKTTIERLAVHYQLILTQLVEKFETKAIQAYSIITDQEYQQIVYQWNQTDKAYPKDKTLHQLFEAQVIKSPNNIALIFKDKSLTYQELNAKSNQLARVIRSEYLTQTGQSLQADTLIALCLERSFEMILSILAVLKAGGAYVPIDPEFPKARIQYILDDTGAKIVLTQSYLQLKLNQLLKDIYYIVIDQHNLSDTASDNLAQYSQPNHLAYVIYTSGTTGNPKGVQISHLGVINVSIAQSLFLGLDSQSTVLQYSPITFDASVVEIFTTLLKCAALIICSKQCRYDVSLLIKILKSHKVNIATIPVGLLYEIYTRGGFLPSLKTLIVAGEVCSKGFIDKCINNRNIINAYGPTENTVCATMHQYQLGDINNNIGKPIGNIKCYILNHYLQPVPVGVQGELYIAGAGLARGYLNQPTLTKKRFINNPFATEQDIENGYTWLYKTGDLCRFLPNGDIEYIGRNDFQAKIRGFRIELEEIDHALSSIPGVQSSVIIVQNHKNKPSDLIAYYICDKCYAKKQEKQIIDDWTSLYNHEYKTTANRFEADFVGWNSYITGKALPLEEMQQWQAQTLQRIKEYNIDNVFDIGVGTGLLMYPLLEHSKHYAGIDISAVIIDRHQQYLKSHPCKVKFVQGNANQIDYIMTDQLYNCIVINSVSQYFPNIQYFDQVILKALKKLKSNGIVFIGDVRDYNYHDDLIEVKQAYHNYTTDKVIIADIAFKENELLIAPDYFLWQQNCLSDCLVDILEKEGDYCNELNQYRYDVIIKKRKSLLKNQPDINIVHGLDMAEVSAHLRQLSGNKAFVIDGVINPWLNQEKRNVINQYQLMAKKFGLDCKLHRKSQFGKGYLSISFSCIDLYTSDIFKDLSGDITDTYNIPWQSAIHQEDIIQALSQKLPQYMIPSYFMRLEKLPLTINGKIDKKALPKYIPLTDEHYAKPMTDQEKKICDLWQSLLGSNKIGINSNFFSIGGNSILAIQAAFQMSTLFNHQVSVADIFKYQTPSALADFLMFKSFDIIKPFSAHWDTEKNQNKPMMYFIHPSCAGYEVYQSMAEKLLAYYHCIGIDNYNLYASKKITSLAALAKYYLSKIILFKSHDQKITLLGWSLGGFIALEMAYWLEQKGYHDIHVILLDTHILGKIYQIVQPSVVDTVIKKMGIVENNAEYIAKIKHLLSIEQGIQQCQLSGKLRYSVVNLFQAEKTRSTNNLDNVGIKIADTISIPTDHFGLIQYIVKHWYLYGRAFEMGNFGGLSQLKPHAKEMI